MNSLWRAIFYWCNFCSFINRSPHLASIPQHLDPSDTLWDQLFGQSRVFWIHLGRIWNWVLSVPNTAEVGCLHVCKFQIVSRPWPEWVCRQETLCVEPGATACAGWKKTRMEAAWLIFPAEYIDEWYWKYYECIYIILNTSCWKHNLELTDLWWCRVAEIFKRPCQCLQIKYKLEIQHKYIL